MAKPNCYLCVHRRNIPGDCHSSCAHPDAMGDLKNAINNRGSQSKLQVRGSAHGIQNGWFFWPINFDPIWLEQCLGFEARKIEEATDEKS